MVSGQCLCGAVRYTVTAPFEYAGYCHCARCRAATGSSHSASAGVRREHLRVWYGEECLFIHRRNSDTWSHFCRHCGSVLFLVCRNDRYAHVQMGTISGDPGIRPQWHMHVDSLACWHEITDSLPQHPKLPGTVLDN
jgi:hypothetical protein